MARKRKKPQAVKVRRVMPPPGKVHPSKRRSIMDRIMEAVRRNRLHD